MDEMVAADITKELFSGNPLPHVLEDIFSQLDFRGELSSDIP